MAEVETCLGELIQQPSYSDLFYAELRALLQPAWSDVREHFAQARNAVETASQSALQSHGLTGAQLALKLRVVDFFSQRFLASPIPRWLKRLLDAIDALLKSVLDAIPGVGGAIEEFKEAVKNALVEEEAG